MSLIVELIIPRRLVAVILRRESALFVSEIKITRKWECVQIVF